MSWRPFPHPWLWRGLFALALVAVIVLSLVSNDALRQVDFIGNDKIGHFLAYFVLMAFAVQLRDAYQRVGITLQDFEGPRFRRIDLLKRLMSESKVDNSLRWTHAVTS